MSILPTNNSNQISSLVSNVGLFGEFDSYSFENDIVHATSTLINYFGTLTALFLIAFQFTLWGAFMGILDTSNGKDMLLASSDTKQVNVVAESSLPCNINNFSWTISNKLARSSEPTLSELSCLKAEHDIDVVIALANNSQVKEYAKELNINYIESTEITGGGIYNPEELKSFIAYVDYLVDPAKNTSTDFNVLVFDKTGNQEVSFYESTFLVWDGWSTKQSIDRLLSFETNANLACTSIAALQIVGINNFAASFNNQTYYPLNTNSEDCNQNQLLAMESIDYARTDLTNSSNKLLSLNTTANLAHSTARLSVHPSVAGISDIKPLSTESFVENEVTVVNGDFSSKYKGSPINWTLVTTTVGDANNDVLGAKTTYNKDESYKITLIDQNVNTQFFQDLQNLTPSKSYQLSFDARSTTTSDFSVGIYASKFPYEANFLAPTVLESTNSWNKYIINFDTYSAEFNNTNARLSFNLSGQPANTIFEFDNVQIKQLAR